MSSFLSLALLNVACFLVSLFTEVTGTASLSVKYTTVTVKYKPMGGVVPALCWFVAHGVVCTQLSLVSSFLLFVVVVFFFFLFFFFFFFFFQLSGYFFPECTENTGTELFVFAGREREREELEGVCE